jgi:putative transposase
MPRVARIKTELGIYHIMIRSISDVALFRENDDKIMYLKLIKKYQSIFLFKIYAYCLMTTHGHIAIDSNGADISKIMKSINQCYSAYFNHKYNRHGHVFQDRFKSELIDNSAYLIKLSAYIHNNPSDIKEYKNNVEHYQYSSLGIYLGIAKDDFNILNKEYILSHFSTNNIRARKSYLEFINRVSHSDTNIDIEFKNEGSDYRNDRKVLLRNYKPDDIIKFISKYTNTNFSIHVKFSHKHGNLKALCILIMRSLCNLSLKEICSLIGNITSSGLYKLYEKGYNLIIEDESYKTLLTDLINTLSVA